MRTEVLIRMQASSEKGNSNSKAMKVAAAINGVESVTLSGEGRSLLRVVGEGIDSSDLITRLRRKVGQADIVELRTLQAARGYPSTSAAAGGGYHSSHAGDAFYDQYTSYPAPAASYSPAAADKYYRYQQQPSYEYYPPAPYPNTVVLHEYPTGDTTGCSIM